MAVGVAVDRVVPSTPVSLGNGARVRTREGRVVGRVAGATPRWLLVKNGWWFPVTRRVAMDQVREADSREVRLAVSADGFFALPVYLPDDEIDRRVWKSLESDPGLRRLLAAGALSTSVRDGVVTLSGNMPDRFYRRKLVELILGMEGVIDVVDRLHDDLEVRRSVERALQRSVPSARIRAASSLGRVTLAGRVGSRAERERALTVAGSLPGVRSVTDRIEVRNNARADV